MITNKDRKNTIGGSDMAGVCGLSPWATPYSIWLQKIGLDDSEIEQNESMYWGTKLEPLILEEYSKIKNIELITDKNQLFKIHPEYPMVSGNIDGLSINKTIIVEAKTTRSTENWGDSNTDMIPAQYLVQVATYASIWNVNRVDIAVLFMGRSFKLYSYHRNKELEFMLLERAKKFWNEYVIPKIVPPLMDEDVENLSKYCSDFVKKDNVPIMANEKIIATYNQFKEVQKEIKSKTEYLNKYKVRLAEYLKDNTILIDASGNKLASYKSNINNIRMLKVI